MASLTEGLLHVRNFVKYFMYVSEFIKISTMCVLLLLPLLLNNLHHLEFFRLKSEALLLSFVKV